MYLPFAVLKLGLNPTEFWGLTFGEFWPLYNAVTGKTMKPMTKFDLQGLEDRWAKRGRT